MQKAIESDNIEEIKAKMKALDEVMHKLSQKIYQQSQAGQQSGDTSSTGNEAEEDVVDAEFTEENDQK